MNSEERSFYKELDRSTTDKKEKSLTFFKLGLFFIILIVILEVILFYIGASIRKRPENEFAVKGISNLGMNLISTSEQESQFQTTISQGAICSKLVEKSKKEVSCSIDTDNIIISGKISPLLPANASAYIKPLVNNGKIDFKLTKVTIGSVNTAKLVAYPLTNALQAAINTNLPANTKVERIDLSPAVMVVITSKK